MIIKVEIKKQYGTERIYPRCETSELLCRLIQQSSFTRRDIDLIKQLGYKIELVTEKVEL